MAAPVITSSLTASGTQGEAFTYTITATNTPTSFSASNVPAGLSLNASTGVLSGTPTGGGARSVTIRAINADGTATQTLVVTFAFAKSVIYQAVLAMKTFIEGLNLPVSVRITETPMDLASDVARPWIMLCPLIDTIREASNASMDVEYQVVVAVIGNRTSQSLDTVTRWRQALRNALHHSARRIEDMPTAVVDITVEPRAILEAGFFQQQQTIASALILRVQAQETWNAN